MSKARDTRNRAFRGLQRPRQLAMHEVAAILAEIECPIHGAQLDQFQSGLDRAFMAAELTVSPSQEVMPGDKGAQYQRIRKLTTQLAEALTGHPEAAINSDIGIAEWLWWGEGPNSDITSADGEVRHSVRSGRLEDILNGLRWLHSVAEQESAGLPLEIPKRRRSADLFLHTLIGEFALVWTTATGRRPAFTEPVDRRDGESSSQFGSFVHEYLRQSNMPISVPGVRSKFQDAMEVDAFRSRLEELERNAQTGAP